MSPNKIITEIVRNSISEMATYYYLKNAKTIIDLKSNDEKN